MDAVRGKPVSPSWRLQINPLQARRFAQANSSKGQDRHHARILAAMGRLDFLGRL